MKRVKQAGFTIVELLIVIVVIGILASITVVAYNGITERARNVARLNAAKQAEQIVRLALADVSPVQLRDSLYYDGSWWRACVGKDYEDVHGTPDGDCATFNGFSYAWSTPALTAILEDAAGPLPSMRGFPPVLSDDGDAIYGPYIGSAWVENSINYLVLEYQLEGESQECGLSPLVYKNGGNPSMTPNGDPKYSANGDGTTECVVALVDHAW